MINNIINVVKMIYKILRKDLAIDKSIRYVNEMRLDTSFRCFLNDCLLSISTNLERISLGP